MELRDYLVILRAHWLALSVATLLGVILAFAWTTLQPRVYSADASGFISTGETSSLAQASVGDSYAKARAASYIDIAKSRAVAEYVIKDLGLDTTPTELVGQISVSNPLDSVTIKVRAEAGTPEAATELANTWLRGIVNQVTVIENDGSLENIDNPDSGQSIVKLVPVDSAEVPTQPTSPNVRLALVIGLLAGLAAGVIYALARHSIDRRVRDPKLVLQETGVSVVGTIPLVKGSGGERTLHTFEGDSQSQTSTAVTEAMRELRTNLQFMDVDHPPRVIVVTSPLPGDGKSTTAANLALSLAAAGQRTVLIDADLRRPVVHQTFGLPGGAGLSDLIANRIQLVDAAHRVDQAGRLVVISAGFIPPNPAELLGSQRLRDLLTQLSSAATVIIDAPPAIPVTDASVLANAADGVLLVLSTGSTTYEMISKASENLTRAGGHIIGAVMNRMPRRASSYYGYQYHGNYASTEAEAPEVEAAAPSPRRSRRGQHDA